MECFASFYEKIRQQHTQEKFAQRLTIALLSLYLLITYPLKHTTSELPLFTPCPPWSIE